MNNNMNIMQMNDEQLIAAAGGEHIDFEYTDDSIGFDVEVFGFGFGFSIPRPW